MTVLEEIEKRAEEINTLLEAIRRETSNHQELAKAGVANWGHVGNLGKVASDLRDIAAFLNV